MSESPARARLFDERTVPRTTRGQAPSLRVDCDHCAVRGDACSDCVVSVLLGPVLSPSESQQVDGTGMAPPNGQVPPLLDADEQAALRALAEAGCLPPLRLVEER